MSLAWYKQLWQMGLLPAGVGRAALDMDLPIFDVELIDSLVPRRAGGIATPTFTRSDGANGRATVLGYAANATISDGPTILTVNDGEARFMGARRIAANQWSRYDANGVPLVTGAGASSLCCDLIGPLGYTAEGANTNLALQSQDLTTTWVVGDAAGMEAVVANAYVAPDGTTTMDKIQTKAANTGHDLNQPGLTTTATTYTYSAYLRYVNNQWAIIQLWDGGTHRGACFDLLNGVAGLVFPGATSTIKPTAQSGVYRVSLTCTTAASGAGNAIAYIGPAPDNTSSNLRVWNAAGTEIVGAWGVQLEQGAFPSTYIPTTTTAITRNADFLAYASAGNISGMVGTCYAEFTGGANATIGSPRIISGDLGNGVPLLFKNTSGGASPTTLILADPAELVGVSIAFPQTAIAKGASTWGSGTARAALNGTVGAAAAFDGDLNMSATFSIGNVPPSGSTDNELNGTIRNVRIYRRASSVDQLRALTA